MSEVEVSAQDLVAAGRMMELFGKVLEWGQNGGSIDARAMYLDCRREYKWYRRSGLPWGTDLPRNEASARRILWTAISFLADGDLDFFAWEHLLTIASGHYLPLNVHLLMKDNPSLSQDEACVAVALGYRAFE